jgi:hypothetical protein
VKKTGSFHWPQTYGSSTAVNLISRPLMRLGPENKSHFQPGLGRDYQIKRQIAAPELTSKLEELSVSFDIWWTESGVSNRHSVDPGRRLYRSELDLAGHGPSRLRHLILEPIGRHLAAPIGSVTERLHLLPPRPLAAQFPPTCIDGPQRAKRPLPAT